MTLKIEKASERCWREEMLGEIDVIPFQLKTYF